MRLAIYHGTFQPGQDGTMTTLMRQHDRFWAEGVEQLVLTPLPPKPGAGVRSEIFPLPKIAFPAYTDYAVALPRRAPVWRKLDAWRPDLVQIGTPDLGGRCVLRWARARGVPVVGAYHTHFPTYLRYYGAGFLEGWLWRDFAKFYNQCDAVLVPTKPIEAELAAHGIGKLVPWPRGVDRERFHPGRRSEELRRRAGVPEGGVLVAYAGRLVSEKNVELVAEAWAGIRERFPAARLMWLGDGPRRGWLERRTPDAFFPGYLHGEDLWSAYASADVLVFCSVTETFGNVVLEGMASGLPAVGVAGTSIAALIEASGAGLVAERAEPGPVAARLAELLGDAALRTAMRERALAFAAEQSWDAVLGAQLELYRRLMAERPQPGAGKRFSSSPIT
ncbi:MAG: glycosyltransferase family 1 protein [Candidatus Sumerlaeia bacterium]|nr:glycosyltransferase family 1 protein [Candidatus Sumerlaeia bacterium]